MDANIAAKAEPKRRNTARTKARILSAANACFAQAGYSGTGLRDIARRADVASSLLLRHFGSKAALFEEALVSTIEQHSVFTVEKVGFGEEMARLMIEQRDISITTMLVMALADPKARLVARRVAASHMIGPLADWLGPPDAEARAANLFALMTGFVIQAEGMAPDAVSPLSVAWLARTLQEIVDDRA